MVAGRSFGLEDEGAVAAASDAQLDVILQDALDRGFDVGADVALPTVLGSDSQALGAEGHEQPHRLGEAFLEDADMEVGHRVVALSDRWAADVDDVGKRVPERHVELAHVRLAHRQQA